jgi:2-dehydro-3-deoxyphosphogluconate aldolase / (4S)-4-hydroxy-2-oxoglutarate aldolase
MNTTEARTRADLSFAGRRVIAVIRSDDTAIARQLAAAAADVLPAVEVTFTVPDASQLIADMGAHPRVQRGEALVGAGTVCDAATAVEAIGAGAAFLVAPNFDVDVAKVAAAAGVLYVPGAFTPSEVLAAVRHGAAMVKLFPASVLGVDFLSAMLAIAPHVAYVPTGGIRAADAAAWFDAGAHAIGVGSSLDRAYRTGGPSALAIEVESLAALAPSAATTPNHGAPR